MTKVRNRHWSPPQGLEKKELTVVACTTHYFGNDYIKPFILPQEWDIPISCNFTDDFSLADKADALWFHGPTITSWFYRPNSWFRGLKINRLPEKKQRQPWILMSMESDQNYTRLKNEKFLDQFDMHMTYRLDSDIPTPYPNRKHYGDFMKPPIPTREKSKHCSLAVYIASNPVRHRDNYVRQLSKYVPVDSLGRCLNNKAVANFITGNDSWVKEGFRSVMDILPQYKFYLAFENSFSTDYVTERVFHALAAGVVPVYYGAKNVKQFLPADNAAINVSDFSSPKELAKYLLYLDQNDRAYEQHLEWKHKGYSESFQKLLDISDVEPLYRMAVKLAHNCTHDCTCGGRIRQRPTKATHDK